MRLCACLVLMAWAWWRPAYAAGACPALALAPIALPRLRSSLATNHEVLIVALGSSSTQGRGASDIGHSYPAVLQHDLALALPGADVAVINRGIGGQNTEQQLARIEADVLAVRPQVVIWQAGANDALHGVELSRFRAALVTGLAALRAADIDVVLMNNQQSPRMIAAPEDAAVERIMAAVARRTATPMFDRTALMDDWRAEGAPYAEFVARDGLHENDLGYRCLGDALARSMLEGLSAVGVAAVRVGATRGG